MREVGEKRFGRPERREKIPERKRIPEEEISIEKVSEYLGDGKVAEGDRNFLEALKLYQRAGKISELLAKKPSTREQGKAGIEDARASVEELKRIWAENLYNSGEKSITEGKQSEAIEYFQKAVNKNPKLIEAWVDLGNLLTVSEKYENAYKCFKEGAAANLESKERWKIWNAWGRLYLEIGEFERAYTCFSEAKELERENFGIYYNLGIVLLNLQIGDPAVNIIKAIKNFERAEKINPWFSDISTAKGTSRFKLGQLRESGETLTQYEKAKKDWGEAIRKDPNNIWAWHNKGIVELILQEGKPKDWLDAANRYFDKVLEINAGKPTEIAADAWYRKAGIWKARATFNVYTEKEEQIKNLKQCAKCLEISLKMKETDDAKAMLANLRAESKKLKEWTQRRGFRRKEEEEIFRAYI